MPVASQSEAAAQPEATAIPTQPAATPPSAIVPKPTSIAVTFEPVVTSLHLEAGNAPCDFQRLYRGKLGDQWLSVWLRKAPSAPTLTGSIHYDSDRPALTITKGQTSDTETFEFVEKGGATFRGTCDPNTGVLSGSAGKGTKGKPFTLWPRPESWPPMHALPRKARVEANHPACRGKAKANEVVEISIGPDEYAFCLPSNPKKRAELITQGIGVCSTEDLGVRVWDLAAKVAKKANRALESGFYDDAVKKVKSCNTSRSVTTSSRILFAAEGVITINEYRTENWDGTPLESVDEDVTVDLETGVDVPLDAIVTQPNALQPLVATCARIFDRVRDLKQSTTIDLEPDEKLPTCGSGWTLSPYLWNCSSASSELPRWGLVEGGIAIFPRGHGYHEAEGDGMGPIISWEALLREKLLKADSPVARVWKDRKPAGPNDPACSSGFAGRRIVEWRPRP